MGYSHILVRGHMQRQTTRGTYLDTIMCPGVLVDRVRYHRGWARTVVVRDTCILEGTWNSFQTYLRVIFSTPTAMPRDISPDWMAWAMVRMAMSPDAHSLLRAVIGTS